MTNDLPQRLTAAADRHRVIIWKEFQTAGNWAMCLKQPGEGEWHDATSEMYITVYGADRDRLIADLIELFEFATPRIDIMNIYKTNLFKYITGEMVKDKPVVMEIRSFKEESVSNDKTTEIKQVLMFKGSSKGAILNKTNAKALAGAWGGETDNWIGQSVELYAEAGKWFGQEGWALRMHPVKAKATKTTNGKAPAADEQPELFSEDDIPFDLPAGAYAE